MSLLRYIERDGKSVLQEKTQAWTSVGMEIVFVDVPTHREPKKVTVEDELTGIMSGVLMGAWTSHTFASAAIEFFKKRINDRCLSSGEVGRINNVLFGEA